MSAPVYSVPSTYPPPPHPQYASLSQPQPSQPISLVEQAILDLTKLVGDVVEEQKKINAQLSQKIDTMENNVSKRIDGLQSEMEQYSISKLAEHLDHPEEESQEEDCQSDIMAEEQRVVTVQANHEIETVESSLNKELDGFQSEIDQKLDSQQESILKLTNQPVQQEEESPKEECLNGTIVEEPCLQQPQEAMVENSESSDIGVVVCLWDKKDAIPLLLTEEAVEEHKENIFPLPPTNSVYIMTLPAPQSQPKTPTANAQATNNPLLVPPSADLVYIQSPPAANSKPAAPKAKSNPLPAAPPDSVFILPMPAAQPKPQASTTKATPSLLVLQNIRRLVASVHAFATTSKTMATAYIAWHSSWFGCGFGFGTLGPRHF